MTAFKSFDHIQVMRGWLKNQNLARFWTAVSAARTAAGFALLIGTTACASNSYMGISLVPGVAPADVQTLAAMARGGDKRAQRDLGIRFEEGVGVIASLDKAARLYRKAASSTPKSFPYYSPAVGTGSRGQVLFLNNPRYAEGLPDAKRRLDLLESRIR